MDIGEQLKEIVSEQLGVDAAEVTPTASIRDDLGADSLDAIELQMAVEEEFDIEVDDRIAETLRTFGDLVTHVELAIARKAKSA